MEKTSALSQAHRFLRVLLPLFYVAIFAYVIWEFFNLRGGFIVFQQETFQDVAQRTFPLFGLVAFTMVWSQIIIGSTLPLLTKVFPGIFRYHRGEGIFALLFAFAHPLLLMLGFGQHTFWHLGFVSHTIVLFAYLGIVALFFLLLTVCTALLRRRPWVAKYWRALHILNYVTFGLIWVHSWRLGADVYQAPLRWLWFGFAVTALLATAWRIRYRVKLRAQQRVGQIPPA